MVKLIAFFTKTEWKRFKKYFFSSLPFRKIGNSTSPTPSPKEETNRSPDLSKAKTTNRDELAAFLKNNKLE